ncbi:DUF72 domain-containing protein [Kineococcus sp. SYSU DK003]|uniref:DUF72 domain-containing protein n=1 Tax=Kineococcus sp. SYSU DK003 TaxID=3383124 RepID=UPI003D7CE11E
MGDVRIGISGWTYPHWRGDFYPAGLRQREELSYAAQRFSSIEINGSFYSLQRPTSYASWREQTPEGFTFAVKGGRYITHLKRLRDVQTPLANFFASGVLELRDRLGPVLWQLPETVAFDPVLLADFFALLPRTVADAAALARRHDGRLAGDRTATEVPPGLGARRIRHTLEARHESFGTCAALELSRAHGVATVVADSAGRWPLIDAVTSDLVHVRLHGDTELYTSRYSDAALDAWAARVRDWARQADVVVYFDNDAHGHAPHDALRLVQRLGTTTAGTPNEEDPRGSAR